MTNPITFIIGAGVAFYALLALSTVDTPTAREISVARVLAAQAAQYSVKGE